MAEQIAMTQFITNSNRTGININKLMLHLVVWFLFIFFISFLINFDRLN